VRVAESCGADVDDGLAMIISIAQDVYETLGSGFSEDVYQRALQVGLRLANIAYESQKVVEVMYRGYYVGEGYPDLVLWFGNERIVVELKAVSGEIGICEEQQLRNYLATLRVDRGLLINFQSPGRKRDGAGLEVREVRAA
jgi:GxxExxY protein